MYFHKKKSSTFLDNEDIATKTVSAPVFFCIR